MLFLVFRFGILWIFFLVPIFIVIILSWFYDFEKKGPSKKGFLRKTILWFLSLCCRLMLFVNGFSINKKEINCDYSEYLGEGYKQS